MMESTNDRVFATAIYISSFPFPILGPLIIWLMKKDSSPLVDYHGREYFNFFISYVVYGLIAALSVIVLIGFVLLPIVGLFITIFTIIGAIKAYEGEFYRIPFIFRIL